MMDVIYEEEESHPESDKVTNQAPSQSFDPQPDDDLPKPADT
jgi:hypothetical protein